MSTTLVIEGIFKYTRNPMYLGLTFILLSACFYFNSFFRNNNLFSTICLLHNHFSNPT